MALMKNMFDWLVTPPADGGNGAQPMTPNQLMPAHMAQQPAVSILVCNFDGPDGREVSQRLIRDLGVNSGVLVQHISKKLVAKGKGNLVERMVAAAEVGRKWLVNSNADVLLWGEVSPDDRGVTIRFLCAIADADTQPGSIGLGDALGLGHNYDARMAELIHAVVLAAVGPRKASPQREEVADLLSSPADKMDAFVDAPPETMAQPGFASVLTAVGNVLAAMWRLKDDPARLDRAVSAYKAAISIEHDEDDPLNWALTQNQLGAALQAQAVRDKDPAPLRAAADAYRAVATALGAHLHVNDWALAQAHLGDVLVKLSHYGDAAQHLKSASEAYQQALKVFTRQTMPGPWSELMNQLGVALMNMGENVPGDRVLEQAAGCFRKSLEVRRRDIAPLLWAQTANNLGAVTFSLFKRKENAGVLNEAAACFKGAFEVYAQFGRRNQAMVAKRNLDRILENQNTGP